MKLALTGLVSIGLLFSLTACGGDGDSSMSVEKESMQTPLQESSTEVKDAKVVPHFAKGVYGDVNLTSSYTLPTGALFLDVRNDWEREKGYATGSVGGVVYEYRKSNGHGSENRGHRKIVETFVDDVLQKALGDKNKHIILICASSSRTAKAAKLLAAHDFTYVEHVKGGFSRWNALGLPHSKN